MQIEAEHADPKALSASFAAGMKLKGRVEIVAPGNLPNDGKVVADQRTHD